MEQIFETFNLGSDENPRLIKIGSTLNEKERKDLKELLIEFQEVFAWSYDDMPSIDPEIAQHHIDTCSHGACQVKVEAYENRMASKDQRRGHQAIECRVHQTRTPSRVDSQCCART